MTLDDSFRVVDAAKRLVEQLALFEITHCVPADDAAGPSAFALFARRFQLNCAEVLTRLKKDATAPGFRRFRYRLLPSSNNDALN